MRGEASLAKKSSGSKLPFGFAQDEPHSTDLQNKKREAGVYLRGASVQGAQGRMEPETSRGTTTETAHETAPVTARDGSPPHPSRIRRVFFDAKGIRPVWRLLIYFGVYIAIAGTLSFLVFRGAAFKMPEFRLGELLPREFIGLFAVLAAAGVMSRIERCDFGSYGLPWKKALGLRFWEGAVWGFLAMTVLLAILRAAGSFSFGNIELHGRRLLVYTCGWSVYFLAVGMYEEFMFRGYPQARLATRMGFWRAAVVLSAIFAALHLANPGENVAGIAQVFLIALLFCLTLKRTGNLWFAVGLHAAWDWAETFFYGVADSGFRGPGHLLNSSFHGPKLLTGGSAGPEGSVIALAIEVAMIGLVMLRFRGASRADRV